MASIAGAQAGPWVSADCTRYSAYFEPMGPGELHARAARVGKASTDNRLQLLLDMQEGRLPFDPEVGQSVVKDTKECWPDCPESLQVGYAVAAKLSERAPAPSAMAPWGVVGLERWPDSAMAPVYARYASLGDEAEPVMRAVTPLDAKWREDLALVFVCQDDWMRAASAADLEVLERAIPSHPPTLPLPIASRWLSLGEPERAHAAVRRALDGMTPADSQPECANPPEPAPPLELSREVVAVRVPPRTVCERHLQQVQDLVDVLVAEE